MLNHQLRTWKFVQKNYRVNTAVIILYVLESHGSSPGRQGFWMAVNEYGEMEGSIGGGIMEHKFVEMAKEKLRASKNNLEPIVKKQHHDKISSKDQSGMICSGEQTILIYRIQKKDEQSIDQLIQSLEGFKNGTVLWHFLN